MSQQAGISFKEFRQRFQTEEACEAFLFEQRWPEVRSVEGTAAIGFTDGVSMSASSAAVKARSQRELFCTIPIFR